MSVNAARRKGGADTCERPYLRPVEACCPLALCRSSRPTGFRGILTEPWINHGLRHWTGRTNGAVTPCRVDDTAVARADNQWPRDFRVTLIGGTGGADPETPGAGQAASPGFGHGPGLGIFGGWLPAAHQAIRPRHEADRTARRPSHCLRRSSPPTMAGPPQGSDMQHRYAETPLRGWVGSGLSHSCGIFGPVF